MYRYAFAFSALMLVVAAFSAVQAEETRVSYPFMAGSLHQNGVDMVYYIDPTDAVIEDPTSAFDVYATFAGPRGPLRERMTLADGSSHEVTLDGVVYRFWRVDHRVHASVDSTQIASATE
ncbi:MAG: hypothetical protein AAF415_02450 [Pseudomonadota bacterium]